MSPTVCRGCGGVITNPAPDKHVCDKCRMEHEGQITALQWKYERPDTSDLTHRLYAARRSRQEWELAAGLAWKIMVLGVAGVAVYWLARQALG